MARVRSNATYVARQERAAKEAEDRERQRLAEVERIRQVEISEQKKREELAALARAERKLKNKRERN